MCELLLKACLVGLVQTGPSEYTLDYLTTDGVIVTHVIMSDKIYGTTPDLTASTELEGEHPFK